METLKMLNKLNSQDPQQIPSKLVALYSKILLHLTTLKFHNNL